MNTPSFPLRRLRQAGCVLAVACLALSGRGAVDFSVGAAAGRLEKFSAPKAAIPLRADDGGFSLYDAAAKQAVPLAAGRVGRAGANTTFDSEMAGNLALHAEFTPKDRYLLVTGELRNLRGGERGVVVEYRIPLTGANARFGNQLNKSVAIAGAEVEGCVYPIAALETTDGGVAMAIPPTSPCEFGMAGGPGGVTVRFFLGLSPETRRFPDRATFSFIIYPINVGWGFRSALSRYYSFFPDYYNHRTKNAGPALFLAEDGKEPEPAEIRNFSTRVVETQAPWLQANLDANQAGGLLSFPYMIVGQREVKYLEKLPASYDEAMAAYAKWTPEYQAQFPRTKENEAAGGDVNLRLEVDSSAIQRVDGKVGISIRKIPWGGNAVSFVTNPNPDLFADTHNQSVGRTSLDRVWEWARKYPQLDGVVIDSLGANWPANFNYRKDHFRYARYPLSIDPAGRPVLDNVISHYEFLETLRAEFRAKRDGKDRYIEANGLYAYAARPEPPHHYRVGTYKERTTLGRFFLAALLDFAVSEPGISSPQESLEFMRIALGRKVYSPSNVRWKEVEPMRRWFNTCLVYDLFAVNQREYGEKIHYYFPDVYERDRELINWFVPKARLLAQAGWQPVTHARASVDNILFERYGSHDKGYWVIMSKSDQPRKCTLKFETGYLGWKPEDLLRPGAVQEIAQGATVKIIGPDELEIELQPYRTCIIALAKQP
jgi:hypothetical protein